GDALAVDIAPALQIIDGGGKRALGVRLLAQRRILARPRHIDRNRRESQPMQRLALAARIFLPAVDAAPVHDDGRTRETARDLEIDDDFFAFQRNFDALDGRFKIAAGLEISSDRALVAVYLLLAARHRVAADAEVFVGEIIIFGVARAFLLRFLG